MNRDADYHRLIQLVSDLLPLMQDLGVYDVEALTSRVHVHSNPAMSTLAHLSSTTPRWSVRGLDTEYPFSYEVRIGGVRYYAIYTVEEARRAGCPEDMISGARNEDEAAPTAGEAVGAV